MRLHGDRVLLSASDLMRFQGCPHATSLDLRYLRGERLVPAEDEAATKILQKKGFDHEEAYLDELKGSTEDIVEVDQGLSFEEAVGVTGEALGKGPAHIFQAALRSGPWGGYADFLERTPKPSRLGSYSYEVVDTKLKRKPDPRHVLQLCLYADLLAEIQGVLPDHVHVQLGDNSRASFRVLDFAAYARRLRERLVEFVDKPVPTRPEPVSSCSFCRWRKVCKNEWDKTDSLCLVANIRQSQQRKLETAGIDTVAKLAKAKGRIPKLAAETLEKLKIQAALQHARRKGGEASFQLRAVDPGKGLGRLPRPAKGDLFFDMEGDPYAEGGLEYLFGVLWVEGKTPVYKAFWAHDREQEAKATSEVLAFFRKHLKAHPDAYIYHYNSYEVTALRRLAGQYGVGENALDDLLRRQKFVDLYRVVQQGLVASEPSYSLKDLEAFYMEKRQGEVATAGDSIVAYHAYRDTGDPAQLEEIRRYNETDCASTLGLRDWLVEAVRPKGTRWFNPLAQTEKADASEQKDEILAQERAAMHRRLVCVKSRLGSETIDLLVDLAGFHRREAKPAWWAIFDSAEADQETLLENLECLAGLRAMGPSRQVKRSLERTYSVPEQETKRKAGDQVPARMEKLPNVSIEALEAGEAVVKFGPTAGPPPDTLDLLPQRPIGTEKIQEAILRLIDELGKKGSRPAIEDLLCRRAPRLKDRKAGSSILHESADIVQGVVGAITSLDRALLPIQGPPGTGKTYVASHAILALALAGKRVAVASNSHKAIDNLLLAVAQRAREASKTVSIAKKVGSDGSEPDDPMIAAVEKNEDPILAKAKVVGGTAWLLAREDFDRSFDYLFIDEAGQVSLANTVAMAMCADNIVLIGDPMQLGQPIQGAHPGDSGKSALEYVLEGHATVPEDRGIFLPVSRRMHPAICRYISDIVYESRLTSHSATSKQEILWKSPKPLLPPAGVAFAAIEHTGNSQSSEEEAEEIAKLVKILRAERFRDQAGRERALGLNDILIVAPYNAQVNLLRTRLPAGARVGTVDKFQGQEAPVCLVSMTTSSGEELPRDIAFLFSTNRLNVAVSRAQALSVVVASPRLLEVECGSIEEMKLVNGLCALHDYARQSG